jgi:hypothetical protein
MPTNFPKRYFSETAVNTFMPQKRSRILLAMRLPDPKLDHLLELSLFFKPADQRKRSGTAKQNRQCPQKWLYSTLAAYQLLRGVRFYRKTN